MSVASPTVAAAAPVLTRSRALYGLGILTLINLFNYLDRYLIAGMLPSVSKDFQLDGTRQGLLATVFIVVYMIASPLGGYLGDRVPRRLLVAGSVLLWSLATVASGLASSYSTLLIARAIVGIGEAGYGAAAPAIIADLFPREKRSTMLSIFYLAIPVGAGAGYALGGWLSAAYSWHTAFFVGGIPGILLAVGMIVAPEPRRGGTEQEAGPEKVPFAVGLRQLLRNRIFWFNTTGYTLMTFSIGGLSFWFPTFLEVERHQDRTAVGFTFGAITVVGGIVGTLIGGWLGDKAENRRQGGGMWISGIGLVLATPFMYFGAVAQAPNVIYAITLFALVLLFLNTGPINAAILNCVTPAFRAFAMGMNVLLIHLLGDALSPTAIGMIKDATSLSTAIILNAVPVLLGGLVLLVGASSSRRASAPPTASAPSA
jgi:MFS family permease